LDSNVEALSTLKTDRLGGVGITSSDLEAMQAGEYILHARNGSLLKHPVEKIRLPLDPEGHVQRLGLVQAPDGTLYATQQTLFHRSTDGGRTWEHLERSLEGLDGWRLQFHPDGTMLNVARRGSDPPGVWASRDEGETWESVGRIDIDSDGVLAMGFSVTRLTDGTLLMPVAVDSDRIGNAEAAREGPAMGLVYRSDDGGSTWPEFSVLGGWCCEVNIHELPTGRLVAAIRYQRPLLPGDATDLLEQTGAASIDQGFPFKHAFVASSDDGGHSWSTPSQLTTVPGQCYCAGVGLSDNRVVAIVDHRYPREMGGGRAMVSHDAGETWENEVYYISHGRAAGYAATITLDGEEMLTLTGSCYGDVSGWDKCIGRTEFSIVRWKLAQS